MPPRRSRDPTACRAAQHVAEHLEVRAVLSAHPMGPFRDEVLEGQVVRRHAAERGVDPSLYDLAGVKVG